MKWLARLGVASDLSMGKRGLKIVFLFTLISTSLLLWKVDGLPPYIFMDAFESGDFSGWDGTSGSPTVVTSPTHHGTYAMQSNFTGSSQNIYAYDDSAFSETTVFVRWYTRFSALPPAGKTFALLQTRNMSLQTIFNLGINETGGTYYLWLNYYGTTNSTYKYAYAFQTNTWYGLKAKYVQDGSSGEVRAWLDGSEVISGTGLNTTSHTFRRVHIGASSENSGALKIWSDCVVIDNADIDFEAAPTIGEFEAPSTVYANQYFFLNITIQSITDRTNQSFVNATIQISNNVILQWVNSTNVFSVNSDPSGYVTLDAATSIKASVNSTSHKLSWNLTLNSYPAGSIDVIVTGTKVFDDGGFSGSGSETGLFTFAYITLTLQARDASSVNLPRQMKFNGTMGNSTTFDSNSNTSAYYSLTTCYGSHTLYAWWGTHLTGTTTQSITSNTTINIDTKIQRLDSGANYLLFSLNNTDLSTPTETAESGWRMLDITATGTIEFKMDNLNWKRTDEPSSFTVGTTQYSPGTGSWSFAANIFTFDVPFSTQTLSMSWAAPPPPTGGGGGGGGGGAPYVPPEELVVVPEEEAVTPEPTPTVVTPAPLMSVGAFLIIAVVVGAIAYGEFMRVKPTPRRVWKKRPKPKRVQWKKPKSPRVKWPKAKPKKRTPWKKGKTWD